jgi:hypothetical protein
MRETSEWRGRSANDSIANLAMSVLSLGRRIEGRRCLRNHRMSHAYARKVSLTVTKDV